MPGLSPTVPASKSYAVCRPNTRSAPSSTPAATNGFCTFSDFLSRLKHKTDLSAERVSVLRQDFRGTQKAGSVRIMAAGVHDACILRAIDALMRLLNGQRVDIRTQNQHFSVVLCALQRAEHAGFRYARCGMPNLSSSSSMRCAVRNSCKLSSGCR